MATEAQSLVIDSQLQHSTSIAQVLDVQGISAAIKEYFGLPVAGHFV